MSKKQALLLKSVMRVLTDFTRIYITIIDQEHNTYMYRSCTTVIDLY